MKCRKRSFGEFFHIKPNDGVVLQESAQNYPGASNGDDNKMTGSNHLQMRNDSNTETKLEELMSGLYNPYFSTDNR